MAISITLHYSNFIYYFLIISICCSIPTRTKSLAITKIFAHNNTCLSNEGINLVNFTDYGDELWDVLAQNISLSTANYRVTELPFVMKASNTCLGLVMETYNSLIIRYPVDDRDQDKIAACYEEFTKWGNISDNNHRSSGSTKLSKPRVSLSPHNGVPYVSLSPHNAGPYVSVSPHNEGISFIVLICCASIIVGLLACLCKFLCNKTKRRDQENQIADESSTEIFESHSPRPFTFEELSRATNNFHEDQILGRGGFGTVYRAILPNGITAAVKRVSSTSQQGFKEYKAEIMIVSRSSHRNLVQLIGWCHEIQGELLLIYELMENKGLDVHLFNSRTSPLPWDVRYKIAQGLAKALRYLHEECGQQCILHMDIKSSNVLLDSNFEPKLSDFGLSKLVDHDKSMELSVMAGTRGYLAPECVLTGKVSTHSDVYSFGVVALELATGRKTIDPTAEENQKVLVKWVQNLYKAGKVMEAVDPQLGDDYNELQVKGLIVVGLWCVLHEFRERPSMREIVRILNNTQDPLLDLHIPSLVPDSVPFDFDSIRETSFGSLDLIVPMEMENPIPVDPMVLSSVDTVRSEDEDQTYSTLFMWRHISVLHLWRYLIDTMWFRSSHNG